MSASLISSFTNEETMNTIIAIILAIASTTALADYTTIVMTPQGPLSCTDINGTMVCR